MKSETVPTEIPPFSRGFSRPRFSRPWFLSSALPPSAVFPAFPWECAGCPAAPTVTPSRDRKGSRSKASMPRLSLRSSLLCCRLNPSPGRRMCVSRRQKPPSSVLQRLCTRINCCCSQLFLNAKKLIVLCNTLASAGSAGLDLTGIQSNRQVRNGGVLSLSGAM